MRLLAPAGHYLEYLAARYVQSLITACPWQTGRHMAVLAGDVLRLVHSPHRRARAARNLAQAFPHLSAEERQVILRNVYRNLMISVVDTLNILRFVPSEAYVDFVETVGFEQLQEHRLQSGIVFATGHFGCWEMLPAVTAAIGYPAAVLAQPLANPYLDAHVRKLRESMRCAVVERRGAMREVVRMLRSGRHVGFLMDLDAREEGVFVDFFGRPASTVSSVAKLSLHTGGPVAVVCGRRLDRRLGFRVELKDLIWPRQDADPKQEIHRITQRFTEVLQESITERPDQWVWLYNRWKTSPGKHPVETPQGRESSLT